MTSVAGFEWNTYPRGWVDVLRCILGRHTRVQLGFDRGERVDRCSCGAIHIDLGWSQPEHLGVRRGIPVPVDIRADSEETP